MSLRNLFDCDEHAKKARVFWFIVLSVICVTYFWARAKEAHDKAAKEVASKDMIGRLWHGDSLFWTGDAKKAQGQAFMPAIGFIFLSFFAAHYIALFQSKVVAGMASNIEEKRTREQQRAFESQMEQMAKENEAQSTLSKLARSKQEVVMRLGSIDQFVRVLETESDVSKRTVALQGAHSEMTTLAAKLASDQIDSQAVEAPEIREHAKETSNDLVRLGLTDDRLNRDIVRMFKLGQAGG